MAWGDKIYALVSVIENSITEIERNPLSYVRARQMDIAKNYSADLGKKVRSVSMSSDEILTILLIDGTTIDYKYIVVGNEGV